MLESTRKHMCRSAPICPVADRHLGRAVCCSTCARGAGKSSSRRDERMFVRDPAERLDADRSAPQGLSHVHEAAIAEVFQLDPVIKLIDHAPAHDDLSRVGNILNP